MCTLFFPSTLGCSAVKDSGTMRRWISFCAYPVFFLLFVAVTVEIGSRLLLDEVDTPETVREMALARLLNSAVIGGVDAPLGMRLSPNVERTVHWGKLTYTVRTNSLGFRGREPAPRAAAEHRILFLGDSMVFGHGLGEEDTLPHRVELRLRTSVPGGVVYNGAISGMNTVQELAAVLQLLPILAPDRVILGYFIGNDPLANTFSEVGDDGRVIFSDDDVGRLQTELDEHLRPLLPSVAFRSVALRYYVPRLRYLWSGREDVLDRSCELLSRIRDVCTQAGARFSVVIIYPRDAVTGGLTSLLSSSRNVGRNLASRLQDQDISVLDSGAFMDCDGADRRFYFPNDGHINAEGARALAVMITDQLILPGLNTAP